MSLLSINKLQENESPFAGGYLNAMTESEDVHPVHKISIISLIPWMIRPSCVQWHWYCLGPHKRQLHNLSVARMGLGWRKRSIEEGYRVGLGEMGKKWGVGTGRWRGGGSAAPQGKSHQTDFLHIFLGKAKYFISKSWLCPLFVARLSCLFITT
jgi:hypothetical protein